MEKFDKRLDLMHQELQTLKEGPLKYILQPQNFRARRDDERLLSSITSNMKPERTNYSFDVVELM